MNRVVSPEALRRYKAAERHANRRDFNLRYGSTCRRPYGLSDAWRRQPLRSKEKLDLASVLLALTMGVIIAATL